VSAGSAMSFTRFVAFSSFVILICSATAAAPPGSVLLLTADTEGHVGPCRTCPFHAGLGGLDRRATLLRASRRDSEVLLLDAGNALFGDESVDSGGKVIVSAYAALGYDALNLSWRDFRFGKDQTLALLGQAKFPVLSANLLDSATGRLLTRAFAVTSIGGRKFAVVGVTEIPPGIDRLPHLKQELAGIRIRPPVEALAEWLPKAKAATEEVVLLYYGSAPTLRAIREKFPSDISLICIGGMSVDQIPADGSPLLVTAEEHGKSVAELDLSGGKSAVKRTKTQHLVEPSLVPDGSMQQVLAAFSKPAESPAPQRSPSHP